MSECPQTPEAALMDIQRRIAGFIPDSATGIYNFNWIVRGQDLIQNSPEGGGKFPWRDKVRANLCPVVHFIRAWRDPVELSGAQFPQLQFGFVQDGQLPIVGNSFRLFDAAVAFAVTGLVFEDVYVEYNQAVPNTGGQPWEFWARNERIGDDSPPYTLRVEVVWSYQPNVRFRG